MDKKVLTAEPKPQQNNINVLFDNFSTKNYCCFYCALKVATAENVWVERKNEKHTKKRMKIMRKSE